MQAQLPVASSSSSLAVSHQLSIDSEKPTLHYCFLIILLLAGDVHVGGSQEIDRGSVMEAPEAVKKPPASWALETVMLPLGMILVQVFTVATLLICKLALNAGMRPFVFLVYRNLIAAAAIAPLAIIFERCYSLHALISRASYILVLELFRLLRCYDTFARHKLNYYLLSRFRKFPKPRSRTIWGNLFDVFSFLHHSLSSL